ncbi:MAG: hypothetical protein WA188_15210 [Terriglobales bacterium]
MKTIFLIPLLLLLGVGAFGQIGGGSPQMESVWTPPDHALHAEPHAMSAEHDLREHSGVSMARGELPAWEVLRPAEEIPLGDVARDYRREHASARRARIVWEQVGN